MNLGWLNAGQRFWDDCDDRVLAETIGAELRRAAWDQGKDKENHLISIKQNEAPVVTLVRNEDPILARLRIVTRQLEQQIAVTPKAHTTRSSGRYFWLIWGSLLVLVTLFNLWAWG